MWLWLCGIGFCLFMAFGLLLKHEMQLRGFGKRRHHRRREEGE